MRRAVGFLFRYDAETMSRKKRRTPARRHANRGKKSRAKGSPSASTVRAGQARPPSAFPAARAPSQPDVPSIDALLTEASRIQAAGRYSEALEIYERVIALDPTIAFAWVAMGDCESHVGRLSKAVEYAERGVSLDDRDARFLVVLAGLLYKVGRGEESLEWARKAIALDPTNPRPHGLIASNLEQMQRIDEGIQHLESAMATGMSDPQILVTLGHLHSRQKNTDAARQMFEQALANPTIDVDTRVLCLNELGHVLDQQGEYDAAFDAFSKCGEETRRSHLAASIDPTLPISMMASHRHTIDAETLRRFQSMSVSDQLSAPAFLVGFPRSGTTMTEQMIAAHPDVVSSAEAPAMDDVRVAFAELVGANVDFAGMLQRLNPNGIKKLRRVYWDSLTTAGIEAGDAGLFLDKLPLNINQLGLINILFPEAKIIVAFRDPRDVCLSCFFQRFDLNPAMIHFLSLEGTARFYAAVMDLYQYLREIITLDVIEVKYEDMVADFETNSRRVIEHLGLPWCDEVLRFHERAKERYILTPSYAGVTEPVYRRAVGRWRSYEQQVQHVLPILQPYLESFGYESDP